VKYTYFMMGISALVVNVLCELPPNNRKGKEKL
jgi:hypothetical protein